MVELEDYEGLRNTSSENVQKEGLSDAQYDYMNELKVSTQEWNNLSTLQQLEQIRVIEERFDELHALLCDRGRHYDDRPCGLYLEGKRKEMG